MGKKKAVQKPTTTKPSSPPREDQPENPPPAVHQQQPPPPVLQPGAMISLDSLADFLRRSNPTVDWATTLDFLTQVGGVTPTASVPPPNFPTTVIPPTTTEISEPSKQETEPSESTKPSPKHTQNEPLDVSPLSAYHDTYIGDESAKGKRRRKNWGAEKRGAEKREAKRWRCSLEISRQKGIHWKG